MLASLSEDDGFTVIQNYIKIPTWSTAISKLQPLQHFDEGKMSHNMLL